MQVPGPLHRQGPPFQQEVSKKESPSRQRRRARRAAARRTNETEAVEANEVVEQTSEEIADIAVDATVEHTGEEPAVEVNVNQVNDEFCSNADYIENILSDENSVSFRFILKDIDDIEVFKIKVR